MDIKNITDINQIKMAVLIKTAQYAFEGSLDEKAEKIPYELTNTIKPQFRCCVYREREIFRQRVRLAMGKIPSDLHYEKTDNTQVVHVISSACEGCPIDRFTVTSNCHNCIAQKCIKACKFGAISKTPQGAFIDKTKCKKCGQCVKACPYNAIVDIERPCIKACPVNAVTIDEQTDLAFIDESKCINCGQCVIGCPFGAISDVSMMVNVIQSIVNNSEHVYAMIAPAIEGQFGSAGIPAIKEAVKALGFKNCYEVALGADAVAYRETEEVMERMAEGKKTTSSCCPAFVNLINKHYPELAENISTSVSPMVATARFIKTMDPQADVVFIGPCIAKKNEVMSHYLAEIGSAITFEELQAMFTVKGIVPEEFKGADEEATKYGKGFAKVGGLTNAVLKVVEEKGVDVQVNVSKCNGVEECKKALMMLKAGRLTDDFIEGMVCEFGCINGPGKVTEVLTSRRIFDKNVNVPNDEIIKNCDDKGITDVNVHRH